MAEKVVKSFTEEERNRIFEIQNKILSLTSRLGEIEIDVTILDKKFSELKSEKEQLVNSYDELRAQEDTLASELREKYGDGTYDIQSNVFTPTE